jgi:hypothetical protein
VLTLRLRWRRSSASWRLRRLRRLQLREQRRRILLQRSLDSSLLREKELEQLTALHLHRLQEMEESHLFRQRGLLTDPQPSSPQLPR